MLWLLVTAFEPCLPLQFTLHLSQLLWTTRCTTTRVPNSSNRNIRIINKWLPLEQHPLASKMPACQLPICPCPLLDQATLDPTTEGHGLEVSTARAVRASTAILPRPSEGSCLRHWCLPGRCIRHLLWMLATTSAVPHMYLCTYRRGRSCFWRRSVKLPSTQDPPLSSTSFATYIYLPFISFSPTFYQPNFISIG